MKKAALALAVSCASFVAIPAFAQDNQAVSGNYQPSQAVGTGNFFIDAKAGKTFTNRNGGFAGDNSGNSLKGNKDKRNAYNLLGGYRWKVGPDLGLGVEAGYADLGNYRVQNNFATGESTSKPALRGWLAGVNMKINLLPEWYLSAHGGYFKASSSNNNYNNDVAGIGFSNGGRPKRGSFYAGVGTGWDINEHFGVGIAYDYYHANAGKVRNDATGDLSDGLARSTGVGSVTAEYRF